jgi:hypothetical protein
LALDPKVGREAAFYNFAARLLERLGYDGGVLGSFSFKVHSPSFYVVNDDEILLLVQEDKMLTRLKDPEP